MNENPVGRWIKAQFRETPVVAWLISINLVLWLLNFFKVTAPASVVAGEVGVQTAWKWLTYPLYSPLPIFFLLFGLYMAHWVCVPLERTWGSEKFARVFVVVTLLTGFMMWVAMAVTTNNSNPPVALAGLYLPMATMFPIWAAIYSEQEVLLFLIIPVKAKYLAIGTIIITYFSVGPVFGLFMIALPICGWFWGKRQLHGPPRPKKSNAQSIEKRRKEKRKSRFKLLEGQSKGGTPDTVVPDLRKLNREAEAKEKSANEAELDRILDKIRFEGMTALTAEEKETLDRQSRKLKGE